MLYLISPWRIGAAIWNVGAKIGFSAAPKNLNSLYRKGRMPQEYRYELWQDGIMVAATAADSREDARKEIAHYAIMYAQDGPCTVREITKFPKKS